MLVDVEATLVRAGYSAANAQRIRWNTKLERTAAAEAVLDHLAEIASNSRKRKYMDQNAPR